MQESATSSANCTAWRNFKYHLLCTALLHLSLRWIKQMLEASNKVKRVIAIKVPETSMYNIAATANAPETRSQKNTSYSTKQTSPLGVRMHRAAIWQNLKGIDKATGTLIVGVSLRPTGVTKTTGYGAAHGGLILLTQISKIRRTAFGESLTIDIIACFSTVRFTRRGHKRCSESAPEPCPMHERRRVNPILRDFSMSAHQPHTSGTYLRYLWTCLHKHSGPDDEVYPKTEQHTITLRCNSWPKPIWPPSAAGLRLFCGLYIWH